MNQNQHNFGGKATSMPLKPVDMTLNRLARIDLKPVDGHEPLLLISCCPYGVD
jgi:hypothetical protein